MQDRKREYREAYQAQLQAVHRVLLEGERLEPPKLKVLPNTRGAREGEARAKVRYDRARLALLGLSEEE